MRMRGRERAGTVAWVALAGLLVAGLAFAPHDRPARAAERLTFRPVVRNAAFPTNLAFAPDGRAFYTEKDTGRIREIDEAGRLLPEPFATLPVDASAAEMGLLGLALHPGFAERPWVYAYYSDARDGHNHLVRIRAEGETGVQTQDLLTLLPTENGWHNGGDLAFGADGRLYVAVGDGHVASRAQDLEDLGGKILRLDDDGTVPADNPFGAGSAVFAAGIRNSFGICVGADGALWETENGPSEWDELNRLEPGANYGWPEHIGPGEEDGFTPPVLAWREIIRPTGCTVASDGSLYVGDFHGDLHLVSFTTAGTPRDVVVASFAAGITDVETSPDGGLYVVTQSGIFVGAGRGTDRGPFSPAGIVVLLALVGLLLFARRRLERR